MRSLHELIDFNGRQLTTTSRISNRPERERHQSSEAPKWMCLAGRKRGACALRTDSLLIDHPPCFQSRGCRLRDVVEAYWVGNEAWNRAPFDMGQMIGQPRLSRISMARRSGRSFTMLHSWQLRRSASFLAPHEVHRNGLGSVRRRLRRRSSRPGTRLSV